MKTFALHSKPASIALILAVLSFILQSCSGNSLLPAADTSTPTATLSPTATFTPSQTPTIPHTEWPLVVSEYFDAASENWPTSEVNNEFVKGVVGVVGGKYYLKLTAKKTVFWYSIPGMDDLMDAYAAVKVDQKGGSKNAEYGIVIRENSAGNCFFSISTQRMGYEFTRFTAGGELLLLTMWTSSSRILVGEPNLIGVKAEGSKFQMFINGEQVDDAKDDAPAAGKIGIAIALPKAGDWIEITFDNFEVRVPQAA